MSDNKTSLPLFDPALLKPALRDSVRKLALREQLKNPVMFVVYLGSMLCSVLWVMALQGHGDTPAWLTGSIAVWLWFTVLFANFAEALAEGRSRAQAASLKSLKKASIAKKLAAPYRYGAGFTLVDASDLRKDDVVLVQHTDLIPCDGEIIEGIASVDESAITGESAPVIRESGGDFSSVTGGTRVLSDWIVVRVSVNPGETFIDRMIAMVEGAKRRKTPNEIALTILLLALTLVFLMVTVTLLPFSVYSVGAAGSGEVISLPVLLALLVCLIPTTIGGLLSAIGVAGMSRLMAANVIATSGRAVEAAGDVDVLLLDKTGTITFGNRQAAAFIAAAGSTPTALAEAAWLASLADDTPEGKSIVVLAQQQTRAVAPHHDGVLSESQLGQGTLQALHQGLVPPGATFVPFTAQSRMSGINLGERQIRKGAADAIRRHVLQLASPASALLSAVIFNALIIVVLIPLALKGVRYRALGAEALLRRNLLVYGLGGLLLPFAGIKLIDMLLALLGLV